MLYNNIVKIVGIKFEKISVGKTDKWVCLWVNMIAK
jgi:hypothetical protein